ncbi:hypothetical protein [Chroococcidiopsis sp.]|uniref:hypothetical protein n=1 Tax=Chroococcidiopsis sp. TaxID=3088168 RepID=UPI003F3E51B1
MKGILKYVYTASRALAILVAQGIEVLKVMEVKVMTCCVWVKYRTVKGICSLFVSVRAFLKLAMGVRKERASEYVVTQRSNPAQFNVVNSRDITEAGYLVIATPDLVTCSCKDFQEMAEYLPQHPYLWRVMKSTRCCKHIYATLSTLACGSLNEYFKNWQVGGRFHEVAAA